MNNSQSLEDQYSLLTKSIGYIKIDQNLCLNEMFIYKNINIWTVYEPIIAIYLLPQIISKKRKKFHKYLYLLKNLSVILFSFSFKKKNKNIKNNYWLFTCFSDYMYKDTISPLVRHCKKSLINFDHLIIQQPSKVNFSFINLFNLLIFISRIKFKVANLKKIEILDNILSKKDLLYIIDYILYNLIPKNFLDIEDAINLFEFNPPKVVMSIDIANPASRIYTVLAKKYNILTIDLQYGHYESWDIEWRFAISNKIFVWGEYYKHIFENNHSIKSEKIIITGSPKFDYLFNKNYVFDFNKSISKIKILFASTYTISSYDNIENYNVINNFKCSLIKHVEKYKNIELTIKPHPLEDITWLNSLSKSENLVILNKNTKIKESISKSQYFISFGSSSTIDAMLQNKICFTVNYVNTKKNIDVFVKKNIANTIINEVNLIYILEMISKNKFLEPLYIISNKRYFLENAVLTNDNANNINSSHIISKWITNTLNNNS